MTVEVLTPDASIFNGEAKVVSLPGSDGSLGILNNHAPLITTLRKGTVKLTLDNGKVENIEVKGGTVEVNNNKVIILAE